MSRIYLQRLTMVAGLMTGLSLQANAQVTIAEPAIDRDTVAAGDDNTREQAGPLTRLNVQSTGLTAATAVAYSMRVVTVTAGGVVTSVGGGNLAVPTAAVDGDQNGTFNDADTTDGGGAGSAHIDLNLVPGLSGDLSLARGQIGTGVDPIVAVGIRVLATTGGTTVQTVDPNAFAAATGFQAASETPEDVTGTVTLTGAFVSTSGANTLFHLVASRALVSVTGAPATTAATSNLSQTTISAATPPAATAIGADADIQVAAASTFAAPAFLGNVAATAEIIGSANNILRITIPTANINALAVANNFIRVTGTDGRDYLGNLLSGDLDGFQLQTAQALTFNSAEWLKPVPANGAAVTDALRVVFNNPLGATTDLTVAAQRAAFSLQNAGANISDAAGEFAITGGNIDPTNPNALLLTVQSTGANFGISSDGRLTSSDGNTTGVVAVRVTSDGNGSAAIVEPIDIFGSSFGANNALTTDQNAADRIAPSLATTPAYLDTNGDGALDAAALVFDEPVTDTTSNTGFELAVVTGVNTRPAYLISPTTGLLSVATLPATVQSATPASRVIPITGVTRGTVAPVTATTVPAVTPRTTNNAVIAAFNPLAFDWDNDGSTRASATPDATEAIPGTNDGAAINLLFNTTTTGFTNVGPNPVTGVSVPSGTITDAAGNRFINSATTTPAVVNAALGTDRAAPAFIGACFFTGDNQPSGANNTQDFRETDGVAGDGAANNRVAIFFSEGMSALASGAITEELLSFGTGGNTFADTDFLFRGNTTATPTTLAIANNTYTFGTIAAATITNASAIRPGSTLTLVAPGSGAVNPGFTDVSQNSTAFSGRTITDCVAPYAAATSDVNQVVQSGGFSIDADADGFVDAIRVKFTQNVLLTSLRQADFTLSGGGSLSGAPTLDTDNSIVNLPVTDGVLSVNNDITLTYNGAVSGASLIAAQASPNGNGVAVSPITSSIIIRSLQQPIADTRETGVMVITGNITNGTTPVPVGTKVYMMNAVPTAQSITAVHNNTEFTVSRFASYVDSNSIDAWTNWLLQLEKDVYLHNSSLNRQTYNNCKIITTSGNAQADVDLSRQVIRMTPNANSLANITFTGSGQSAAERVTNGRVTLCWDVLRSSDGTLRTLYDTNCGSGGYSESGAPILSRAVVTDNTGNYVIHHSGPSGFNGRTRLNADGRPVIVVVEFPDGRRFAASSLLTSVNGRPLLFKTNIGNTVTDGAAQGGVRFDINLANIAGGVPTDTTSQTLWPEWNTISYARDGGFATAAANLPLLPNGVTATSNSSTRVVVGTTLTAVNALNQFVAWRDSTGGTRGDGMWTATDDAGGVFGTIVIDYKCFNSFAFTMTSRGVQLDNGITGFTGGYAAGVFNASNSSYGLFQFGPRFGTGVTSIFGTGSAAFPTNGSTRGWVLAAAAASATTGGAFLTANADSDYAIRFNNKGPKTSAGNALEIDVTSQSSTANGTGTPANANNLGAVPDEAALFVHYDR